MQSSAEQSPSFRLVNWSSPLSVWNKASHCAQTDIVENNPASGSDAVKPMATRATQALVLSSQLYLVLLLIAESWLEWGEERLEVQSEGGLLNRGMEGGRETRQGRGDGRSLGTEQLPISQLPLLNTGITEEAKSGNIHRCGSIFPHPPLSLTALFSSLFIVVSILPRKLSFSDSFCRSLLHRLSWFSTFWCPPLCFLSLLSISITLPPMCGQRAEACTWLRSTPSPVTVITDINTRPICRITAINQAALLKGHLVNFHLPAALTDSLRVWYGMET